MIIAPNGGPAELHGARVIGLPSRPFLLYPELRLALPRQRMREMLLEFRPDVLHVIEPALLGIGGIYYGEVLRLPLVISAHTNLHQYLRYYRLGLLERFIWAMMRERHSRANLNLCTSTVTLKDLHEHGIEDPRLWERAVDAELFSPEARSAEMRAKLSGGEPEKPLLLYVGRLSAEKEVASLREVIRAHPGARLALVGDGPERQNLERYFAGTPTVFTGYMRGEELASAYASADLFLMPSRTETLGLVVMEAMAAGLPVVACRAGGVPDAVQDGVTGFLFEPNEPDALLNTVARALSRETDLESIRKQARQDAERHSWQAATDHLREMYQETIDNYTPRIRPVGVAHRVLGPGTMWLLRTFLK